LCIDTLFMNPLIYALLLGSKILSYISPFHPLEGGSLYFESYDSKRTT